MRKALVILMAAAMVFGISGLAAADFGDITQWSDYGPFNVLPSSSTYWHVDQSSDPQTASLNNGLKLTFGAEQQPGYTYEFGALYPFSSNQTFAIKVPFEINNPGSPNSTSIYHFGLSVRQQQLSESDPNNGFFVTWGSSAGVYNLNGTGFLAGAESDNGPDPTRMGNPIFSDATSGTFGLLYDASAGTLYLGVKITGEADWQELYNYSPGWTGDVWFGVSAGIDSPTNDPQGSFSVTLNNVQTSPSPVPIPPTLALLAPGLLAVLVGRRRFTE